MRREWKRLKQRSTRRNKNEADAGQRKAWCDVGLALRLGKVVSCLAGNLGNVSADYGVWSVLRPAIITCPATPPHTLTRTHSLTHTHTHTRLHIDIHTRGLM